MPDEVKLQCSNCNSILLTSMEDLRGGLQCRFCAEELRPTHDDRSCAFCRGEGFTVVSDVVWICQLGEEE